MSAQPPPGPHDPFAADPSTGSVPYGGRPGYPQQAGYPSQYHPQQGYPQQVPGFDQQPVYPQQGYPQQGYPQQGQPQQGQPQQAYGPQGFPQQGWGHMPPPPQGSFAANLQVRPGFVTAASVLAFVVGGLTLVASILVFGSSPTSVLTIDGYGFLKFLAVLQMVLAAALIWGGVRAITGKDARILTASAAGAVLLQVVTSIFYFQPGSVLGFIIPVLIVVFARHEKSRAWFDLKGAKHF